MNKVSDAMHHFNVYSMFLVDDKREAKHCPSVIADIIRQEGLLVIL